MCWPEEELHGTTAIPKIDIQAACSQNLVMRTVTAIKKWQEGSEKNQYIQYYLKQLNQDSIAQAALVISLVDLENSTFNWI